MLRSSLPVLRQLLVKRLLENIQRQAFLSSA
jgi:hypothetical protein